jgi:hypothetical protein
MTAEWTFMVYVAGDNDLSAAGDEDLREMRTVGSTAAVNVVAEFDNAGDHGTRRFHVRRDGVGEPVETLDETDSGSPETLLDFVAWAAAEYPAERYALVLWNHGGGWEPAEVDRVARSVGAAGYSEREAAERSATPTGRVFFRSSLQRIFRLPTPADRAICSDDGSGHSLDTLELGGVLGRAVEKIGRPFDLLGMDACLMSNYEVAYEIRDHARYLVASEENEPANGWPYDRVLGRLAADPGIDAADLAAGIVDDYMGFYRDQGHTGDVTQSAFDLARVAELAAPFDALADALAAHMPAAGDEVWKAQRGSARFWHNTLWDVSHFCEELEKATADDAVRTAAAAVRAALAPGRGRPLLAEAHRGAKVEKCGGVTLYLLPPLMEISRFYSELAWAKDHRWLRMLEAYHAA